MNTADYKNGVIIGPKANSYWLYDVPWGMYKALMYIKERYGNPTVVVSENGICPALDDCVAYFGLTVNLWF